MMMTTENDDVLQSIRRSMVLKKKKSARCVAGW